MLEIVRSLSEARARLGLATAALRGRLPGHGRARMTVRHQRRDYFDRRNGVWVMKDVDDPETVLNVITNAGRIALHKQGYDTTGLLTNGFNYIALSNDSLTETASSTTLSSEITTNGLARAQGTVTLPTGTGNVTTIAKTFTATGTQSAQKAALFTASSGGTMNHALSFTQRNLVTNDTLTITYSITLG